MSIQGISILSIMSAVALEFLVHMIIYARTGRGKANDKPFAVYLELICEALDNEKEAEMVPIERVQDDAFPAA